MDIEDLMGKLKLRASDIQKRQYNTIDLIDK